MGLFNYVLDDDTDNNDKNDRKDSNSYNAIENMFRLNILNKMMTGNSFVDALISYCAMIILTYLMEKLKEIITATPKALYKLMIFITYDFPKIIYAMVRSIFIKDMRPVMIDKTVEINYITDNKTINELYKAVHWYLSNADEIDFVKESPLKFTFEKKIIPDSRVDLAHESINKFVTTNKVKHLVYKNHIIRYTLSNELITVYSDKDRKRENYKITLSTQIDSCSSTDILEEFCKYCLTEFVKNISTSTWEQKIYMNETSNWNSKPSNNRRKIDTVILQNNLKEDIKNDIHFFLNSEKWYQDRDVPYTRGYLFYGHPGTGKTSMIKAISLMCKRHIHYLILNNVDSDAQLIDLLGKINYKETILVIEDIDCMDKIVRDRDLIQEEKESKKKIQDEEIESSENEDTPGYKFNEYGGREFRKNTRTLTLSGLLNSIDGPFTTDGRILIMTTNRPEVLDRALIRPGRVDRKFLFDYCDRKQIQELYQMFFDRSCSRSITDGIKDRRYSPAHITSVFLRFRDLPEESFSHLDDDEDNPTMEPIVRD